MISNMSFPRYSHQTKGSLIINEKLKDIRQDYKPQALKNGIIKKCLHRLAADIQQDKLIYEGILVYNILFKYIASI
jgi:hypothetical protein